MITEIIHLVDAHAQLDDDWETALVDMELYAGGEVWAKDESTALLQVGEGLFTAGEQNFVRVAPNTIFTLEHPDTNTIQLNLQEGQIWINVEGLSGDETFEVETSTAVASVEGTRFSVRIDNDGQTIVSSQVHTITVATDEGAVSVGPHRQTSAQGGELPAEPDKISDIDSIRWGLAAGPELSVIAPMGEMVDSFTVLGMTFPGMWSGDGQIFSVETYRRDLENNRNSVYHYNVSTGTPITGTVIPTRSYMVAYSPVGTSVAWLDSDISFDGICSAPSLQDPPTCFDAPPSTYLSHEPRWSPDGEYLLYQARTFFDSQADHLFVSKPDGSETIQVTAAITGSHNRFTWSPDSTQIAYSYAFTEDWNIPGEAWIVNADGTNPIKITGNLERPLSSTPLAWSPDGQWLALSTSEGLTLINPVTFESHLIHTANGGEFHDIRWSPTPTGWPLLYSYYNSSGEAYVYGDFYIFGIGDPPQDFFVRPWGPVYSPDGKLAAYGNSKKISDDESLYESTIYFFEVLNWWSTE